MNLVHQSCWKPPLFFSLLVFVSTLGVLSILIAYNPSRCSTDNPPFLLVLLQGPVTYCALPCCLLLHTHLTYSLQTVISLKAGPGFYLPLSCRTHSGCLINVLLSWPENWGVYLGQSTVSIARSILRLHWGKLPHLAWRRKPLERWGGCRSSMWKTLAGLISAILTWPLHPELLHISEDDK